MWFTEHSFLPPGKCYITISTLAICLSDLKNSKSCNLPGSPVSTGEPRKVREGQRLALVRGVVKSVKERLQVGTLEEARASGVEMGWIGDTFKNRGTMFGLLSAREG